ncbi:hypothetical protein DFJ77DRAFT_224718 [Powellomyces hirtus]|nr:hypothetical protein DFJ77DRAFT_224718 [Powellomyces hirtus]
MWGTKCSGVRTRALYTRTPRKQRRGTLDLPHPNAVWHMTRPRARAMRERGVPRVRVRVRERWWWLLRIGNCVSGSRCEGSWRPPERSCWTDCRVAMQLLLLQSLLLLLLAHCLSRGGSSDCPDSRVGRRRRRRRRLTPSAISISPPISISAPPTSHSRRAPPPRGVVPRARLPPPRVLAVVLSLPPLSQAGTRPLRLHRSRLLENNGGKTKKKKNPW